MPLLLQLRTNLRFFFIHGWTLLLLSFPNLAWAFFAENVPSKLRFLQVAFSLCPIVIVWLLLRQKWILYLSVVFAFMVPFEVYHIILLKDASSIGMIGTLWDSNPAEIWERVCSNKLGFSVAILIPIMHMGFLWGQRNVLAMRPKVKSSIALGLICGMGSLALPVHIFRYPIPRINKEILISESVARTFPVTGHFKVIRLWTLESDSPGDRGES
ncbi:MAG TPA: hypothetical protein PKO15_14540 [Fibrobacteria bacterium]|nr:hypothetical protein [Fibrobacteria bacterium]